MIADAHCHFFSSRFFETLGRQRGDAAPDAAAIAREAGFDPPGSDAELAARWIGELDRHGVDRAALIASVAGDEASVATAVALYPARVVGFFVLDPAAPDAGSRLEEALRKGLKVACVFPAMHRIALYDERVLAVAERLSQQPGTALFAHCGAFSVGVRKKLGLPSPFESRYGNPIDLQLLAARYATLPVIVPHFGAGMFREALMLADLCSNVYLDSSSSNSWIRFHSNLTLKEVFRQALAVVGARRILFGTDSSFFPRGWQKPLYEQQREVVRDLPLAPGNADDMFGGNFNRLFPAP